MAKTVRMTTAQAIVKFLDNQYVSMDGVETKFCRRIFHDLRTRYCCRTWRGAGYKSGTAEGSSGKK